MTSNARVTLCESRRKHPDCCPLLSIPQELRDEIYHYLLHNVVIIINRKIKQQIDEYSVTLGSSITVLPKINLEDNMTYRLMPELSVTKAILQYLLPDATHNIRDIKLDFRIPDWSSFAQAQPLSESRPLSSQIWSVDFSVLGRLGSDFKRVTMLVHTSFSMTMPGIESIAWLQHILPLFRASSSN